MLGGILFAKTLSTTYTFANAPDGLYFISAFSSYSDSPISTNSGGLFIKISNSVRVLIDAQGSDGIYAKYGGTAWKKIC